MQELFNFTPFASSGDGFNLSATVKDGQPWFIAADVCRSPRP
jgi:prophage antirepressor-like protein